MDTLFIAEMNQNRKQELPLSDFYIKYSPDFFESGLYFWCNVSEDGILGEIRQVGRVGHVGQV